LSLVSSETGHPRAENRKGAKDDQNHQIFAVFAPLLFSNSRFATEKEKFQDFPQKWRRALWNLETACIYGVERRSKMILIHPTRYTDSGL
jgi:hypothetical protein